MPTLVGELAKDNSNLTGLANIQGDCDAPRDHRYWDGPMNKTAESSSAANSTIAKFGYPDSLVVDYEHWVVLLRPQQATLGALVLVCKGQALAFADIGPAAFAELPIVVGDLEAAVGRAFSYDKINYLMLMMVDPHVHFHVLPRYGEDRTFAGSRFRDAGWPALPDMSSVNETTEAARTALIGRLRETWSGT